MLPSEFQEVRGYRSLQRMFEAQLDMQFADMRTLLRLPREDADAGCNFAAAAMLFNLIAGASVVLYNARVSAVTQANDRGKRFKDVLEAFYPWEGEPLQPRAGADALYKLARNPLAHTLGLDSPDPGRVTVLLKKSPLSLEEIEELENSISRPGWAGSTIEQSVLSDGTAQTIISIPMLYWGVHRMF